MRILILISIISLALSFQAYAQGSDFSLTSSVFESNQEIPTKYTCSGVDVNPSLTIKNIPLQTKSLVLIIHDPDAPAGDWTHWAIIILIHRQK